jgi:hypothetical protein
MDTPEEAKQKLRDIAEAEKARLEKERPRTYTERLQDMGRLPKPSGGGGGGGPGGADLKSIANPKAMKKGGKISASTRADGCAKRGKTKGRIV